MKKRQKTIEAEFEIKKIYLNDLQEIYEILREISEAIELKSDEYVFEGIKEIEDIDPKTLNYFEFFLSKPEIKITINNGKIIIDIPKETLQLRGIYDKIKQVIEKRTVRKPSTIINFIPILILMIFITLQAVDLIDFNATLNYIVLGVYLLISTLLIIITFPTFKTQIYLKRDIEIESFWIRNKDKIFLIIISSVVSAILTFLIFYFTGSITF